MSLFDFTKEGKGVGKEEKSAPALILFFRRFGQHFWQIIVLNILYLFACAPIVTIGPATAGLTYVMRNFSQNKPVEMFKDFFAKAKEHFLKGIIIEVVDAVILALAFLAFHMWTDASIDLPSWLRTVAVFFIAWIFYIFVCANFYIFPMMVSFDLKLKPLIRNCIILGMYKFGSNILMIIVNLAVIAACFITWPSSLAIILTLPFAACNFFNNSVIFPILVKHVATPEEKQPEPTEEEIVFKDRH